MGAVLDRRARGVLVSAGVANALIFLDQTSVTVALPAIQADFDSSTAAVQWTIGAYLLPLAAFMASAGRLADIAGRKLLFMVGLAVFGVASIACALAPSDLALIAARVVQGLGAALTQPLALAHATSVVGPERRGWAIGVLATAGTTCLAIGPLIGAVLVEALSWRWIFALNVPIVAVAFAVGMRCMSESREERRPRIDVAGLMLLTIGLGAVVAALLHMRQWPAPVDLVVLGIGVLALACLPWVERRVPEPLLPLGQLRAPPLRAALAALVIIQGAVLGVTVYVVLYAQNGLGLTPIEAGLVLVPAMVWTPLLSIAAGRIADRRGARLLVGPGLILAAAGLVGIAAGARAEEALWLAPGLLAFGLSRPFVFTPSGAVAIRAIPAEERGLAASLVTESRQVGAVLGVAAVGSIVAAFETGGVTAGDADGLAVAMLATAAVALVGAAVALRLLR